MRKFTKSLMTLALLCVAGVANAQEDLPVTGWVHEWVTNDAQTDAQKDPDGDGIYTVYVRSNAQAYAAGNGITTDGNPLNDDYSNFADWDSQFFITFGEENALQEGDIVRLTMDVKADVAATISTQSHAAPGAYLHWQCVGDVSFGTEWNSFDSGEKEVGSAPKTGTYTIAFNLAKGAENHFYFKNIKVEVVRNIFDTSKNHMLLVTNGASAMANPWDYQANYKLPTPMVAGKTYIYSAAIKAVNGGETRLVPQGDGAQYLVTKGLWEDEFTKYEVEFTASGNFTDLEIDLGACAGEVYFDNVSLVDKETGAELIDNGDFETKGTAGWSSNTSWRGTTLKQVEYDLTSVENPGVLISVGEANWRSFRTGSNVAITDMNVHAYAAKYIAEGNYIELTEVTEFGAWQCALIEAPQGNWMVRSPDDVTPIDDAINDLRANGPDALPGDGTLYALAAKNGVVGFYRIADDSEVPAWAIYMQIGTAEEAPAFIGLGGNTTSISDKIIVKDEAEGVYYNLAGQRVAQPTKGLYIVNGKKYIVK